MIVMARTYDVIRYIMLGGIMDEYHRLSLFLLLLLSHSFSYCCHYYYGKTLRFARTRNESPGMMMVMMMMMMMMMMTTNILRINNVFNPYRRSS